MLSAKGRKVLVIAVILLLPLLSWACSGALRTTVTEGTPNSQAHHFAGEEYRIRIGDELDIKFYYNPELSEDVVVRPDGHISLQLAHHIPAAGLTPTELMAVLKRKYSAEIVNPEVAVIVRSFSAQKVYVSGQVEKPGIVEFTGSLTVLQAIAGAGGLTIFAKPSKVHIIRRDGKEEPEVLELNLKRAIKGTDMTEDILLIPNDSVFVF